MIAKAKIKYLRISPRKLRLVFPIIKNKTVPIALSLLRNTNKRAAGIVYKAVHSAAANAKRFPNINENDLYVSKIFADGGPVFKRFRAQPMGTATTIRKRTSHLTVELDAAQKPVQHDKPAKKVKKVTKVSAKGGSAGSGKKDKSEAKK